MPETPTDRYDAIVHSIQKKTGKSLDQWLELLKKSAPRERKQKVEWLKTKYNLTNGLAKTIIKMMYEGIEDYDEADLIKSHFNGSKDYQKPIYDKIVTSLKKWGLHKIVVNKSYLSLISGNQFATIKTTKDGMVISVPAEAVKAGRNKEFIKLKNSGSSKISHKIVVNDVSDLSDGVMRVLKIAYQKNAKAAGSSRRLNS